VRDLDFNRLTSYLETLDIDLPNYLEDLRADAEARDVPIIRRSMHSLIRTLLAIKQPKRILEVGAAVGYSSLLMAHLSSDDTTIITMESYEPRILEATENFKKYDTKGRITLMPGDALVSLKELTKNCEMSATEVVSGFDGHSVEKTQEQVTDNSFDFVFMDAAKGQYMTFLEAILPMTKPGTIILTDNILQDGDILESHYAIRRRDRTIHARMRDFLYEITHRDDMETTIIPLGDGAAVTYIK